MAFSASPLAAATSPGFSAALASSQATVSASRPLMAAQVFLAITATPTGRVSTSMTPGTLRAAASSTLFTVPPKRGLRASTAVTWPGRRMSMAKMAVPSVLDTWSSRCSDGLPISV